MKWLAFMSRTGSELAALMKQGFVPDTIVINKKGLVNVCDDFVEQITKNRVQVIFTRGTPTSDDYHVIISKVNPDVITLHGWLRIIPADVVEKAPKHFYNLHPGLITEYPELKGKDPVERALAAPGRYEKLGGVIHKVTAGVDEGEWVHSYDFNYIHQKPDEVYKQMAEASVFAWNFLLTHIQLHTNEL